MTNDLYCSTDGCGDFENNVSKILVDISTLQNKDLDQDARLEALELLDISAVITVSNNALLVANAIDAKATLALSTASIADGKVDGAISVAATAVLTVGDALADSAIALNKAFEAYNAAVGAVAVAGYADAKAVSALSASGTAVSDAAAAVITANAADGKADIAVYDSNVAVVKVNKAIITDAQTLTTGQKLQARTNIGAVGNVGDESIGGIKTFIDGAKSTDYGVSFNNSQYVSTMRNVQKINGLSIPFYMFSGNTSLTSFADNNYSVGYKSFSLCSNLKTMNFSFTLYIEALAFIGCSSLDGKIKLIAYSVGSNAFDGTKITEIDFMNTLTLYARALKNISTLETIILRGDTLSSVLGADVFDGTLIGSGTGFIYVPDALYDAYLIATNWSVYASQIKKISELNE